MIYFIVFGDTMASIAAQTYCKNNLDSFATTRLCYVLILGVMLLPFIV